MAINYNKLLTNLERKVDACPEQKQRTKRTPEKLADLVLTTPQAITVVLIGISLGYSRLAIAVFRNLGNSRLTQRSIRSSQDVSDQN
jgi:hypothetical protein